MSSDSTTLDHLIDQADRCLYRAKVTRDRIVSDMTSEAPDRRAA